MPYSVPVFLSRRFAQLIERTRTNSVPTAVSPTAASSAPASKIVRPPSVERLKTPNPPLRRASRSHDRASNM